MQGFHGQWFCDLCTFTCYALTTASKCFHCCLNHRDLTIGSEHHVCVVGQRKLLSMQNIFLKDWRAENTVSMGISIFYISQTLTKTVTQHTRPERATPTVLVYFLSQNIMNATRVGSHTFKNSFLIDCGSRKTRRNKESAHVAAYRGWHPVPSLWKVWQIYITASVPSPKQQIIYACGITSRVS